MKRLLTLLLCLVGVASFAASPSFQQTTNIAKSVTTSQLTSNNVYTGSNYFAGPVTTKTLATTNFTILGTNGVNFTWEDGAVPSVQLIQGGTNYGAVMNFSPGTGKGQIQGAQLLANEIHDFNGDALRINLTNNTLVDNWNVSGDATVAGSSLKWTNDGVSISLASGIQATNYNVAVRGLNWNTNGTLFIAGTVLHFRGAGSPEVRIDDTTSKNPWVTFNENGVRKGYIQLSGNNNCFEWVSDVATYALNFVPGGSTGVGINTRTPKAWLHIKKSASSNFAIERSGSSVETNCWKVDLSSEPNGMGQCLLPASFTLHPGLGDFGGGWPGDIAFGTMTNANPLFIIRTNYGFSIGFTNLPQAQVHWTNVGNFATVFRVDSGPATFQIASNGNVTASGNMFIPTNAIAPAPSAIGGWLWNSNNALFWVTSLATNLIATGVP